MTKPSINPGKLDSQSNALTTRVMITKKKFSLMWDGMNFFIYKTKIALIFNFVKQ